MPMRNVFWASLPEAPHPTPQSDVRSSHLCPRAGLEALGCAAEAGRSLLPSLA